jgi:hypothetical protein
MDICKLGIPEFMIKINGQTCYEVQKIEQIDFTEDYYNEVKKEKVREMASYIYKLSLLSQKKFSADEMQSFMKDSFDILMKL